MAALDRVVVTTDPLTATKVVAMLAASGPWRRVVEVASGIAERVIVVEDDDETPAERVYFVT